MVVGGLGGLATECHHHEAGDGDRLASQKLRILRDVGDSGEAGATDNPGGRQVFDSCDEPRQPYLGRTADSRRTAQAWHCARRIEREHVHSPPTQTAIADLADFPRRSRQDYGLGRLIYGADVPIPGLYVYLVLAHDRRRIIHFAVTAHPTAEWTA